MTIQRVEGDEVPGNNPDVVEIAKEAAKNKKYLGLYEALSSKMCWDAVLYCFYLANLTNQEKNGKTIFENIPAESFVTNSSEIPVGHIIGFFENNVIKHAMISTGSGKAAGNKNDCMGIGKSVGWEELDLPAVNEENGGFTPNRQNRTIIMRHKAF